MYYDIKITMMKLGNVRDPRCVLVWPPRVCNLGEIKAYVAYSFLYLDVYTKNRNKRDGGCVGLLEPNEEEQAEGTVEGSGPHSQLVGRFPSRRRGVHVVSSVGREP